MRFALDTFTEIRHGTPDERVRAFVAFGVWIAAGAFIVSTASHYLEFYESNLVDLFGGIALSVVVMTAKFT